jgi:catechol 2,3-dioxygenase-like lactoylglutathione lyase family enzyme
MRPSSILETVLYASDLDAAEAFYTGVLGLELYDRAPPRQLFYRCGDAMLLIFNPVVTGVMGTAGRLPIPPHGATGPGHVCFRASAPEIDAWRARLIANGVPIESDFAWPGGGRSLYFRDPAGNSLEFAEPRIWDLP